MLLYFLSEVKQKNNCFSQGIENTPSHHWSVYIKMTIYRLIITGGVQN